MSLEKLKASGLASKKPSIGYNAFEAASSVVNIKVADNNYIWNTTTAGTSPYNGYNITPTPETVEYTDIMETRDRISKELINKGFNSNNASSKPGISGRFNSHKVVFIDDDPLLSKNIEVSKDKDYRVIVDNRNRLRYFSVPKGFNGDKDKIFLEQKRKNSSFQELDELPESKKRVGKSTYDPLSKLKKSAKITSKKVEKKEPEKLISLDDFIELNKKFITTEGKGFPQFVIDGKTFKSKIKESICFAGVMIFGTNANNQMYRGYTTGRVLGNGIEIIGARISHDQADDRGIHSYIGSSLLRKELLLNFTINTMNGSQYSYEFCRIKIKSFEKSAELFGFKTQKKEMVGKIFNPTSIRFVPNFTCKTNGEVIDTIDIKTESGKYIKFHYDDLIILSIDESKLSNIKIKKIIKVGVTAKIVDDRRIDLKKGDIVKIVDIKKSQCSPKKNQITVTKGKSMKHYVVLQKQLKVI